MAFIPNLNALSELLQTEKDDSDSDEEIKQTNVSKMSPGDVGPKKALNETKSSNSIYAKKLTTGKDIWDKDEIQTGAEYEDIYDARQQPEYEIIYKQAVSSEDMFLGMGNKSPATSSCEDMIVKIKLPDTSMSDVKLDVKDTFVDCRSPKYKLGLHLPHRVDAKNGKAQWDKASESLNITLKMMRDYDFMNF